MFESIPTREIQFSYLDDLTITIRPAVTDLNPLYLAAGCAWVNPLRLAAELPEDHPRHLTEERALHALAKAYGMAVLTSPCSDPEMDAFTPSEWEDWLLGNLPEFQTIRDYAPVRTNFVRQEDVASAAARIAGSVADEFSNGALG